MSKNLDIDTQLQPLLDEDYLDADTIHQFPAEVENPRVQRRLWLIITAFALAVLLASGILLYWLLTRPPAVQYTQAQAQTGNISVKISATGPISPNAQYNMNFSSAGQISEIGVTVGQQVKQGQTLAKLTVDMTTLQDNVNAAQLAVTSAQNSLNQAQAAATNAQTAYKNTVAQNSTALKVAQDQEQTDLAACTGATATTCQQTARDKFAQTQSQLNASNATAHNQLTASQNQVVAAQDALNKAKQQIQAAQHNLDTANTNAILVAPANATVAAINGVVGQNIGSSANNAASSSNSSNALIVLTDTGKLSIAAAVNEVDIANVRVGQPAQFTVAAYPNSIFHATVSAVNTIGQTTSNIVSYTVYLAVDTASLQNTPVYAGMTATVSITTQQRIGALLIPAAALTYPSFALQNNEISRSAFFAQRTGNTSSTNSSSTSPQQRTVLELKDGNLTPVTITVGLNNGNQVEVLSGLQAGDQVVVSQTGGNTPSSTTPRGGRTGAGTFGGGGNFGGGANGGGRGSQ